MDGSQMRKILESCGVGYIVLVVLAIIIVGLYIAFFRNFEFKDSKWQIYLTQLSNLALLAFNKFKWNLNLQAKLDITTAGGATQNIFGAAAWFCGSV